DFEEVAGFEARQWILIQPREVPRKKPLGFGRGRSLVVWPDVHGKVRVERRLEGQRWLLLLGRIEDRPRLLSRIFEPDPVHAADRRELAVFPVHEDVAL